jgi:predicted transcriptional regulator
MDVDTETAADLVRSRIRVEILAALRAGAATKYELRERLDCSRTTVDRNLEHLQEAGWIEQAPGGYELTTCGEIVVEQATAYLETVTAAKRLQPILRWLPRDELDIDVRHFADAEITTASDGQPMAMVDRHVQAVSRTPTARMVLPVASPQGLKAQVENFSLSELSVTVVVPPAIADAFLNDSQFADTIASMREAGAIDVSVTEKSIPYYLGILDDIVQIGVDEDGQPRGLLESAAEPVREWAEQTFESYKQAATPLATWE